MQTANKRRKAAMLIAGIVAVLFCTAGIATIIDWGVSPAKWRGERIRLISHLGGGAANRVAVDRHDTHDAVAVARPPARCARCGVIESILVVDMRDETTGVCAAGDEIEHGFRDKELAEAGLPNLGTLAQIVADVVIRNALSTNTRSAAAYELTVRFPDGARSTIRLASQPSWKPGERVLVIDNRT